jgi:hypothetical protein
VARAGKTLELSTEPPGFSRGEIQHPVDGMASSLLQHFGIFSDFSAYERAQTGQDVAAEAPAADDHAEDLAFHLAYAVPDDLFRCGDHHVRILPSVGV